MYRLPRFHCAVAILLAALTTGCDPIPSTADGQIALDDSIPPFAVNGPLLPLRAASTASFEASTKIRSGSNATLATPGATSAIMFRFTSNGAPNMCSGTVINAHMVLTAAHCTLDLRGNGGARVPFYLASSAGSSTANKIHETDVMYVRHPDYVVGADGRVDHDVAVMLLMEPLPRTCQTGPDCGASGPANAALVFSPMSVGRSVRLVGYGPTDLSIDTGGVLRAGSTSISRVFSSGHVELDWTTNTPRVCGGDSGGPLMISNGTVPSWWMNAGTGSQGSTFCVNNTGYSLYTTYRSDTIRWLWTVVHSISNYLDGAFDCKLGTVGSDQAMFCFND